MGWMASWVAVHGAATEELIGFLGLVETGRDAELGGRGWTSSFSEQPSGWLVVVSNDLEWGDPKRVVELSRFGPTVGLQFEDKVEMQATACGAAGGVELWRVHHHNDPIYRLDVTGDPPPELADIRDRLFREQDEDGGEESDVDFIHEIPIEIAKAVTGFCVDDVDDHVFKELAKPKGAKLESVPTAQRKVGFLARLFGRN